MASHQQVIMDKSSFRLKIKYKVRLQEETQITVRKVYLQTKLENIQIFPCRTMVGIILPTLRFTVNVVYLRA